MIHFAICKVRMTHVTSIATFMEVVVKINWNLPLNTQCDTGAKIRQTTI